MILKEHRSKIQGLSDLLNYALLIDEGIVLQKDGSLLSGLVLRGPDPQTLSAEAQEAISASINKVIRTLGNGWLIHADFVRTASQQYPADEESFFPDPTSRLFDEERRQQYSSVGEHFESCFTIYITFLPSKEQTQFFSAWFFNQTSSKSINWEKVLSQYQNKLNQIITSLSIHFDVYVLNSEALLQKLFHCITGEVINFQLSDDPIYLDNYFGCRDLIGGMSPQIGSQFIGIVSVNGICANTEPGMLHILSELPFKFRWSTRFIPLDRDTAIKELKRYRRHWLQKRKGILGIIRDVLTPTEGGLENHHAVDMANDVEVAIEEAESDVVKFGYYTSTIILLDNQQDQLNDYIKAIQQRLEMNGFVSRVETINALEAWLGSLPGHGYHNIRRPLIHSLNFADMLPLYSTWPGQSQHPCQYFPKNAPPLLYADSAGSTPFRLYCHVGDVGHTAIFGATGAGKSTLVGTMAIQHLRYQHAQVFLFDKGYSAYPLCHAVQGVHYEIASESQSPSFYPLKNIDQPSEINWACEWIESLIVHQGVQITGAQRKEIRRSLLHLSTQKNRTLTNFKSTLQDADLKSAMTFYTLEGVMGSVLDADCDDFCDAKFQVFEMSHLLEKGIQCTQPTLLYLFHEIEKSLQSGYPTMIIIEEGHAFLEGQFGEQLERWLLEKRKTNTSVIFVDQNIAKVMASPYKHVLLQSCPTKIFLPQCDINSPLQASLFYDIGLNEQEINILKRAIPKRHYYYTSPLGRRLLELQLGPLALSIVSADGIDDRNYIKELIRCYGQNWVFEYLKQKNLTEWADHWLCYYTNQELKI